MVGTSRNGDICRFQSYSTSSRVVTLGSLGIRFPSWVTFLFSGNWIPLFIVSVKVTSHSHFVNTVIDGHIATKVKISFYNLEEDKIKKPFIAYMAVITFSTKQLSLMKKPSKMMKRPAILVGIIDLNSRAFIWLDHRTSLSTLVVSVSHSHVLISSSWWHMLLKLSSYRRTFDL